VLNSAGDLLGVVVTITQAPAPPGLTALSLSAASALIATASGAAAQSQGSFGAETSDLDPATAAAADVSPGALIDAVEPGGPAASAGLQAGDIVTSVDGIAIGPQQPFDPASLGLLPGDIAEVTVVRAGASQTVAVRVGTAS
jgi:S1-C subfamily serine protease